MSASESEDELIDRVVEIVMRGKDPQVEALIASTPDMPSATRDKLRKVAAAFGAGTPAAPVMLPRDSELPFAQLGPYKLLSRMGEGGMGMVYLAEHAFLKRRVALKIIRPELAFSEVTRQRFHREAMTIAKLRHDNIVSVYDAGEHDGVAFLAMEVVAGQGLDELLRAAQRAGERMDVSSAVRHARGIALALQCAHDAGVIHRDVKPSNVRITPDGRELLLDFGLSLADEVTSLSTIGHFRGTPQYAAPEQLEMDSAELDARTDVYSLGVTLYECLTGQVPFASANMHQLFLQILTRDPPEPRTLNEDVDQTLNRIVMRAIAKHREDRFSSAGEMAWELGAWLRTADQTTPAPRRARTAARWLVVAVSVLALGTAGWRLLRNDERALDRASQLAQPVISSAPRHTTALLGASGVAFDQRLNKWDPVIGRGTFGADEDGPGVVGVCTDGITIEPHPLPGGNGRVRGGIEPIAIKPGERTAGAGVGIEFSNGRIVALFLVLAADSYDVRLYELVRDGESRWTRGTELDAGQGTLNDGQPLVFTLSWNDIDTQFDWDDAGTPARSGSLLIPRRLRDMAQPSRFLLIVEQGSSRFEDLVLEES